jgi:hypothetical protein
MQDDGEWDQHMVRAEPMVSAEEVQMIVNGSTYLLNGAPQHCALCHAPFIVEDDHVKCWRGKGGRYYCCPEHADFGLEQALAAVEPIGRKMS